MIALLLLLPADAKTEFFETKVRPALVAHCLPCHDAKKSRGGLRLDSRQALLRGGDTGPALVPGDAAKSLLISAIGYKDVDLQMPPRGKLPDAVIADLTRWVNEGAVYPGGAGGPATEKFDLAGRKKAHWAWQPLSNPPVPPVAHRTWLRDPLDAFILAKLEAAKLTPAPDAEPQVLARRLAYDLTGLPPSEADLASLDGSEATLERYVDRLLARPAFGEKWARHWLDLVRYAETRGHEFDFNIPNAYQYRDYVIRAWNENVPYDRLLREHVAGDLLPQPRLDSRGDTNESILGTGFWFLGEEVHSPVDVRADQADRFDNRIDVLTKTFLGLTVSCARCHDHKFDAISTRDYYALYGFLSSSNYRQVRIDGWSTNRRIAERLAAVRAKFNRELPPPDYTPPADKPHGEVIVDYADLKPGQWLPDDVSFGPGPVKAGTYRLGRIVERTAAEFDPFWGRLASAPGTENEPGSLSGKRAGRTLRTPEFRIAPGRIYALVRGAGRLYAGVGSHIMLAGPLHGRLHQAFPTSREYRWISMDLSPYVGQPAHLEFTATSDDFAVARVIQAANGPPQVAPAKPPVPDPRLFLAWRTTEEKLASEVQIASRLAPAMQDGSGIDEPVFIRGQHKTPGPLVPRRFLEALSSDKHMNIRQGSGRLLLAEQMVDPNRTPLTPRVAVNRLWHHLFGRGIVATVDDFGVMGQPPTHPELLDYLASRFVREGWDLKRMIRALVLSRTYRQASTADATAEAGDPENKLWHRAMPRRLTGEAIRDTILHVSGRLDPTPFGPSVPVHLTEFQDGRGRPASGPIDGNGRRSIYLGVRRNFLSSFLLAFDTPAPFSTVGRRTVSNVPAQSLILMNDPFVQQQATLWAKREAAEGGTPAQRIERMFFRALGRAPRPEEQAQCLEFLGQRPSEADWSALAHALFNVKEFIYVH
jgi:hypothetical protein